LRLAYLVDKLHNLLLGILDKLGVQQQSFGDSTGKIEI
jgi:hypothetical protein